MKSLIEKLSDLEIIKVTVDGTLLPHERKKLHSKAISDLNMNGYNRLLFDVRKSIVHPNYTADDSIDMANYMKTFELPKNTKLAFINIGTETPHKTFIIFASIIGDMDIKHFINYDEAINWLCQ